jgi:hypothetical protein
LGANRCFCLTERLGDCILGTIVFRKLLKETNEEWAWASKKEYVPVAREFTSEIIELPKGESTFVRSLLNGLYREVRYVTPWWFWNEWNRDRLYLLDIIARKAIVTLKPEERRIILTPDIADIRVVDNLIGDIKNYIVISGTPHYSGWQGADWPFPGRIELVRQLKQQGYKTVSVGGTDSKDLGCDINLKGKTSYHQTVEVIKRARLYIGNDCGASWLACAAHDTSKVIMVDQQPGRPGRDGYQDCLYDDNIVDLGMKSPVKKILTTIQTKKWLEPG